MINQDSLDSPHQNLIGILNNIFADNMHYVRLHPSKELLDIQDDQHPRATIVACSDSRVQSNVIDDTPINDLFFVRNIGNYCVTGSVDYGVRQLHTPLLLIIGHVGCGAIDVKFHNKDIASKLIADELERLSVKCSTNVEEAVIENINYQVKRSCEYFKNELDEGKLMILGAVYDFINHYKFGYHKLLVVNCNGTTDAKAISQNPYLKDIPNIAILSNTKFRN